MARYLIALYFFLSCISFASTYEDVVLKKDGSILKGTVIKQNFEAGILELKGHDGRVTAIQQSEIIHIKKEPLITSSTQPNSTDILANQIPTYYEFLQPITGVFYLGSSGRTNVKNTNKTESTFVFNGFNIAAQRNLTQHLAFYTDMNYGSLSKDHFSNNKSHSSIQASLLFGTNFYHGWQVYAGAGKYYERFISEHDSESFRGHVYHLGTGYSWKNFQCHLRFNFLGSDKYPTEYNYHRNSHLQVGVNF